MKLPNPTNRSLRRLGSGGPGFHMTTEPDPLPADRFIGETCSFDHEGKRLVGKVESKVWVGYAGTLWVGYAGTHIPNYALSIRGDSGKLLTVDMYEQYATFRR